MGVLLTLMMSIITLRMSFLSKIAGHTCPKCGRSWALKEVNRKALSTRTESHQSASGTRSTERRTRYRIRYRCKYCFFEEEWVKDVAGW